MLGERICKQVTITVLLTVETYRRCYSKPIEPDNSAERNWQAYFLKVTVDPLRESFLLHRISMILRNNNKKNTLIETNSNN